MNLLKIALKYLLLLILVTGLGLYVWFWAAPVGINNYVNKVSAQLLFRSPDLLTSLGVIDNTPLDFHSGKLGRSDKQSELEALDGLREGRGGLNDEGPEG